MFYNDKEGQGGCMNWGFLWTADDFMSAVQSEQQIGGIRDCVSCIWMFYKWADWAVNRFDWLYIDGWTGWEQLGDRFFFCM